MLCPGTFYCRSLYDGTVVNANLQLVYSVVQRKIEHIFPHFRSHIGNKRLVLDFLVSSVPFKAASRETPSILFSQNVKIKPTVSSVRHVRHILSRIR